MSDARTTEDPECIQLNLHPSPEIYAKAKRLGWTLKEAAIPSWITQGGNRVASHVIKEASE